MARNMDSEGFGACFDYYACEAMRLNLPLKRLWQVYRGENRRRQSAS